MGSGNLSIMDEVLTPKFLVVPKMVVDLTTLKNETGHLAYDTTDDKLKFVTATGVTGAIVTST